MRDEVKVVFSSSSSIYGAAERYPTPEDTPPRPLSPYGITKLACEQLAAAYGREFGLDCVVLRYFNAFGPRQRPDMAFTRIAFALATGGTFELYGDGDAVARLDLRRATSSTATIAAMERGSGTYNVGGALEASMNESIALFEEIAGRTLDLRRQQAVPGDQRRTSADTTRIRAELGWEPHVSLREGLTAQWEWAQRGGRSGPCRVESPPDDLAPQPGLDAEREIDLARWRAALRRLWWLVAAGLVLGGDHRRSSSRSAAAASTRPRR